MYNAVFSAVMTLTGLAFAALGLLLEGQEKHWLRHARVWAGLRSRVLLIGVAVFATCGVSLSRIDSGDKPRTSYWWLTIVLFVASLWLLSRPLLHARRLVDPQTILQSLQHQHFQSLPMPNVDRKNKSGRLELENPDWRRAIAKARADYMRDIKELLTVTSGTVNLRQFMIIQELGLMNPSHPTEGLVKVLPRQFPPAARALVVGDLAVDALSEANSHFDAVEGNRSENVMCVETMASIATAWLAPDPKKVVDSGYKSAASTAKAQVLQKATDVLSSALEGALSAPRPSLTLVNQLAGALATSFGAVSEAQKSEAINRVLSGVRRAFVQGNREEAAASLTPLIPGLTDHQPLEILLQGLDDLDDDVTSLVLTSVYRIPDIGKRAQLLQNFYARRFDRFQFSSDQAVEQCLTLLTNTSNVLAADNPAMLQFVRENVKFALRKVYPDDFNMNPVFLMMVLSRLRCERAALKDPDVSARTLELSPGSLSDTAHGARADSIDSRRVPPHFLVWHCVDLLENGMDAWRRGHPAEPLPPGGVFSAEVRRAFLTSISFIFIDLLELGEGERADVLLVERLVRAVEAVFEAGVLDLGDVPLLIDRVHSGALAAVSLATGRSPREIEICRRWLVIVHLCEAVYDVTGWGRPTTETRSEVLMDGLVETERVLQIESARVATAGPTSDPVAAREHLERLFTIGRFLRTDFDSNLIEEEILQSAQRLKINDTRPVAGQLTESEIDAACVALLTDIATTWTPVYGDAMRACARDAIKRSDVALAFALLRAVRSCFRSSETGLDFAPKGPRYVFQDPRRVFRTGLIKPNRLFRSGSAALRSVATDWVRGGFAGSNGELSQSVSEQTRRTDLFFGQIQDALTHYFPHFETLDSEIRKIDELKKKLISEFTDEISDGH